MQALQVTTKMNTPVYYNAPAGEKNGMEYIRLGKTGAVVSRICLGLMSYADTQGKKAPVDWILSAEEGEKFVKQALDAGINFFDTADFYLDGASETFFGKALQKLIPNERWTREDLFISTKVIAQRSLMPNSTFGGLQKCLSRKTLFAAVDGSLKRLQLDYIDLYLISRFDPNTAIEETMRALHDLVQLGKVRYIGASSMYAWQFSRMQRVAEENGWTKFSVMQNHLNAVYREEEREMIPFCIADGVACTPYAPLAAGLLARPPNDQTTVRSQSHFGPKMRYFKTGDDAVVQHVNDIAKQRGVPPAQIALAWVLQRPGVTAPVVGVTKDHHISDAVKALQIKLTADEMSKIETDYLPHAISGHV